MGDLSSLQAVKSESLSLLVGNKQPIILLSSHSLKSTSDLVTSEQDPHPHLSLELLFCDRSFL